MKAILMCLIVLDVSSLAAQPIAKQPDPLYFAEAFGPARIATLKKGIVSNYYARGEGGIHSLATAPDGTVYFSNANRFDLYKIVQGAEVLVYAHSTYLRDVAVDSQGKVYFSESTGAGGDGTIYRLDGSQAVVFYRVRLSQVDGFWAGTFAFGYSDSLWLSSGNRSPASLYKVVQNVPQRAYTAPDGSIFGFFFEGKDSLLYADFGQRIYRLTIPEYQRSLVYSSPSAEGLSAVAPVRR